MAESKYTAPNDFRAFCEALGETEASMCHHGIKGQRWGERKYQDHNGRLTALGRQHYGYGAKNGHGDTGLMNNKLFKNIKPGNVNYYDDITGEKTKESYQVGNINDYLNVSKKDIKALRKDPDLKGMLNAMKDFRKTGDMANALNEINKINKVKPTKTDLDNVLKATYPSRYDGKKMGLSSDLKLERITPNYERPEKSSAYYSSTIKNGGRDVKIYIDVPASGGSYKDGKMEERVKVATQVATNKDFLKELKTKKEMLLNDVNEQDAKQLMKTAYVAWVDVNNSGKNGHYGLRGYKTNGNKEYMEGQFMTLPNGKIVPLEPYVSELD